MAIFALAEYSPHHHHLVHHHHHNIISTWWVRWIQIKTTTANSSTATSKASGYHPKHHHRQHKHIFRGLHVTPCQNPMVIKYLWSYFIRSNRISRYRKNVWMSLCMYVCLYVSNVYNGHICPQYNNKHYISPTVQQYNISAPQHYNTTTLRHYNTTTLQRYSTTTLQH